MPTKNSAKVRINNIRHIYFISQEQDESNNSFASMKSCSVNVYRVTNASTGSHAISCKRGHPPPSGSAFEPTTTSTSLSIRFERICMRTAWQRILTAARHWAFPANLRAFSRSRADRAETHARRRGRETDLRSDARKASCASLQRRIRLAGQKRLSVGRNAPSCTSRANAALSMSVKSHFLEWTEVAAGRRWSTTITSWSLEDVCVPQARDPTRKAKTTSDLDNLAVARRLARTSLTPRVRRLDAGFQFAVYLEVSSFL
ncbi:hypothetical protein BC830DRAFT_1139674 [Chytriomyces sp. MP71]|nr:hypothetical protein BC830DRAFT_1139674 [Chytriomyces sp. MP71]